MKEARFSKLNGLLLGSLEADGLVASSVYPDFAFLRLKTNANSSKRKTNYRTGSIFYASQWIWFIFCLPFTAILLWPKQLLDIRASLSYHVRFTSSRSALLLPHANLHISLHTSMNSQLDWECHSSKRYTLQVSSHFIRRQYRQDGCIFRPPCLHRAPLRVV